MKTAVSIPDAIFERAEQAARRLRLSRSELYAKAVAAFVERETDSDITKQLNAVYGKERSTLDRGIEELQTRSIGEERW